MSADREPNRMSSHSPRVRLESRATRWALAALVLAGLVIGASMWGDRLPLGGADSVGSRAAWATSIAAGAGFAWSYFWGNRREDYRWRTRLPMAKRIIDILALVAGVALIANLTVHAVFTVFQLGFLGLAVDPLGGAVLAGAAAAACAYFAVLIGDELTSVLVVAIVVSGLFLGTLAAMISSPDATWWQFHFSMLGNDTGANGYQFNLSLVITGLLLTTLADFVGHDLDLGLAHRGIAEGRRIRRVRILRWEFAAIGICIMVVGLVPDAVNFPVHVSAGSGMVVAVVAFFLTLVRLVPDLPRDFSVFSTVVIAGIAVAILLWVPIGYYNLTGMETMAAGGLFAWLFVLARTTRAYAEVPAARA